MRTYIFDFKQSVAIERGIDINDILVLDYLIKFFDSGNAQTKYVDGKNFAWISYDKINKDLPILNLSERGWQRLVVKLLKKKLIERKIIDSKCFIYVNQILLYKSDYELGVDYLTDDDKIILQEQGRQKCQEVEAKCDKIDTTLRQNCHPIVNYYKNKIKILLDDDRVKNLNGDRFIFLLKSSLKPKLSELAYDICVKNMEVIVISDKLIVLSSSTTEILKSNTRGEFYNTLCETLNFALNELD